MTWHELPELPKPDVEVLAEIRTKGLLRLKYIGSGIFMTKEKNFVVSSKVKRWAYIEEE